MVAKFSSVAVSAAEIEKPGTFYDFEQYLLETAESYDGKTHEKIFGKGYAIQWCAKYCDKMLTDAFEACGWDTEGAWGAYNDNIGLAPAWAYQFETDTFGGYYCWKNWQSNHISHYGYKDSDVASYVPRVGDIVCVNWNHKPDPETGELSPNAKDINHVGIIVKVDSLYSIYVSEGNMGTEEDPRFNKVGNRSWTRKNLEDKFTTTSGTIIAVCRPMLPDYVKSIETYELDITTIACPDTFFQVFYANNNLEVKKRMPTEEE